MAALLGWSLLSACLLVSASQGQKNITAESGQNVTLPCRAPNINIQTFEWSRADLETQYVLLYRDELLIATNQHPSFKNRVELQDRQMKDGDVSLILKDVTVNDTGTYECRVKARKARRKRAHLKTAPICTITLSVVAPPGPSGGSAGLMAGLVISALLVAAAGFAGFVIYRKYKDKKRQGSC